MKLLVTCIFVLSLGLTSFAQNIKETVSSAFKSGNAKELAGNFTSSLDLVVKDSDDVYSKAQAEQILKKFFNQHKPSSFKILHDGESRNGIKFFIGELETSNGKYRVTINMKQVGKESKIHQLRIE